MAARQASIRFSEKMDADLRRLANERYGPDEPGAFSMIVRQACRELIKRGREAKK